MQACTLPGQDGCVLYQVKPLLGGCGYMLCLDPIAAVQLQQWLAAASFFEVLLAEDC
jgi:hypothetical protein